MPDLLSLVRLERGPRTLVALRKEDKPPFAGRWLLPGAVVGETESAEEALENHIFRDLGIEVEEPEFAETLYLEDEVMHERYVANIFRVSEFKGDLRFRTAGDYDDVRWLAKDELAQTGMPAVLREWLEGAEEVAAEEGGAVPVPCAPEAPDNRAAWNAIAKAYQERYQFPTDRLVYAPRCPGEDELGLLGDVTDLDVIVLGCGGGQDCIVLAKQGARVTGIDLSDRQIEFGRRLAEREDVFVTLIQGNVEDLKKVDDETQDIAVSLHALNYVERVDRAFAEAFRVLRPGAPLVFSVHHPFDACLDDTPPYGIAKRYWEREQDWQWDFPARHISARMRSWYRPISEWHSLLTEAGFQVERMLEPEPTEEESNPWDTSYSLRKMRVVPANLVVRAVKP